MRRDNRFCILIACLVMLFAAASSTASSAACTPPAKVVGDDLYNPTSIQDAYDHASITLGLSEFTLLLSGEIFSEDLFLDHGTVTLDGGYDCSFSGKTGAPTGIYGTLTVSGGAANFASDIAIVSTDKCDFDRDLDGFTSLGSCLGSADDCNDLDPAISPGASELCDGFDNNCDGQIDEGFAPVDADGDGYFGFDACGVVANDCNDADATIHPDALDIPYDGIDQDCNGADLTFDNERCLFCHTDQPPSAWPGLHDLTSVPDASCAGCHAPIVTSLVPGHYGRTVLTDGNAMTAGMVIECESCHDPNSSFHNWGTNTVWPKVLAATPDISCDTCHESRAAGHVTATAHDNRISDPVCGDCHSSSTTAEVDALHRSDCTLCHNYTGTAFNPETVRQVILQGVTGTPVSCNDCHHYSADHHGGGSSVSGDGCVACHGHDAGSLFDPDASLPYTAGSVPSQGRGTVQSHSTHTELDADDARGPGIYCDSCHDIADFPYFKSGSDVNGDGRIDLAETDVCDNCHSAGGAFDGINDPNYGVKANWTNGIYAADGSLQTGKEFWCASCHDGMPANSKADGSGVAAPDKVGDNSNYGYYATGHGVTGQYNATLHGQNGPGYSCTICHDSSRPHFSHSLGDNTRFASVPDDGLSYTSKISEVCLDCHQVGQSGTGALGYDSIAEATIHSGAISGNFNNPSVTAFPAYGDSADYAANPGYQCEDCHEVHGTTKLAMVLETIDGQISGTSNPVSLLGFAASDVDLRDLDPSSAANDGVCDACHALGNEPHPDTNHPGNHNQGNSGSSCIQCHSHSASFAHGAGGAGADCGQCHGKDVANGGVGTTQSHSTHTETDADDARGPGIGCADCHDINNFPFFKSGTDSDGDGKYNLVETDVCDTCHSPGGSYDGVNDPLIGAKQIWRDGAYAADGSLQSGKQKWCAGCHDESPSIITGVSAPNVIGDENGDYTYGTGWGYYKTGHGLASDETFPFSGGVETLAGRPVDCANCHDFAAAHIDGEARTYDDNDSSSTAASVYRQGYRLKLVDGQDPLLIPRPFGSANDTSSYRVCFQVGCHDSGPFTDPANMNTNLVTDGVNRHEYHLKMSNARFASDWSGEYSSGFTCVACHNVHGSTQLAMVRDGKLVNRQPGLQIWYKNDNLSYISGTNPPVPADLPLTASDGTAWIPGSSTNLCAHCHGSGLVLTEDRAPFQDVARAPVLSWTGETDLISDGVVPDSAYSQSRFTFRVVYQDDNNDSPSPIQVWVDQDDNGSYETDEQYLMTEIEAEDLNLFDGKIYTKSIALTGAGAGNLNYRFYASDGEQEATGEPTSDSTVTLLNNPPTLTWTGEDFYQADGVNPNIGGAGDLFTFQANFTDPDNEVPAIIQAWIDLDDNNSYSTTERYDLTAIDAGDSTTSDGKLYATSLPIVWAGDGTLAYRFYAADAQTDATGTATQDNLLTVLVGANSPPLLEFVATDCSVSGVKPQQGAAGADFDFTVRYVDPENEAPTAIEVWIDGNDDGSYAVAERYALSAIDSGDTNFIDGKLYRASQPLDMAGDNVLNYRFYATDGTDPALGDATTDHSVTVVDALKVRPAGGAGWYSTIQSAIDAIDGEHTVLVYEGTYNEDLLFEWGTADSNTTLRSVCGPDTTIISGSGTGPVVTFSRYSPGIIDGFQVTGGSTGIVVNGTEVSINNCKVHDNNGPDGGGIAVVQSGDMPKVFLTDSEIYNNSSDRGGGVRIWRGSGHVISNTIIRNNSVTGDSIADGGGGVHLFQIADMTISDSVIKDNVSTGYAGGGMYVSQLPDTTGDGLTVSNSVISGNTTDSWGGGIYSDLSKTRFVRSSIIGNSAEAGGAIAHPSAGVTTSFENCILADNQAGWAGMAKMNGGTLDIINSTIANNQASTSNGGAIYNQLATVTIRNSILWGNHAATTGHIAHFNGGSMTISDSIIQSGDDENFTNAPFFGGNVVPVVEGFASEDDPWFVGSGDYHLLGSSPAIDNASAVYAPDVDIDGQSRPLGPADDIGADEYLP